MARTDHISAALVGWMDKAFNNPDKPPVGDLSGGAQLRPGVGLPALDNFDDCTMAWVMAGTRGKTDAFPTMADYTQCGAQPVYEFLIGIARCSEALGEGGRLPDLDTLESEFAVQEDDKDRLEIASCQAVKELQADNRIIDYALAPIETYGPMGATVAVYRTILVMPTRRKK